MKRRDFLGSMLAAGSAVTLINSPAFGKSSSASVKKDVDVLVVNGSIAGCLAAIKAAKQGNRVLLVESRSFLGSDIAATLRPWIKTNGIENISDDLKDMLFGGENIKGLSKAVETPLHLGVLKKNLLKSLQGAGVDVLFMSQVAGTLMYKDRVAGVVVGNKSGLQTILAKTVIDCSEDYGVARMAGSKIKQVVDQFSVRRVIEYFSVSDVKIETIDIPSNLGVSGNRIMIHPGGMGQGHAYVEFLIPITCNSVDYKEIMSWETGARTITILLAAYLKKDMPEKFGDAVIVQSSSELRMPPLYSVDVNSANEIKDCRNLFVCNGGDMLHETWDGDDLLKMNLKITSMVDAISERVAGVKVSPASEDLMVRMNQREFAFNALSPQQQYDHRFSLEFYALDLPAAKNLPQMDACNVLVVGGGTAGASAAISAGRMTGKVTVVDAFSGLGGTGTLGGINNYYHGYSGGFNKELDQKVYDMTDRISARFKMSSWNVEAKMMALFYETRKNDSQIFFRTKAVGVVLEGKSVKGIIALNADGLSVIRSEATIDATGDGDLAVWSGVKSVLGDARGGDLQTYNLCNWRLNKQVNGVNLDLGVIDITNNRDASRGILIGHKYGVDYDFSQFPCVRESRHIEGDYHFSEEDVFLQRRFPDAIAIGLTDFDSHGLQGSLLARLGYIPYHRDEKLVRIPYRVCLPKGIEGLLVIGKALSASRDAFCFMRMQRDQQNLGYAIGMAAAEAAGRRISLRSIDINKLQKHLLEKGIIRQEDIGSPDTGAPSAQSLVESLVKGDDKALLLSFCLDKNVMLPLLEEAYASKASDKLLVAMALARFGSNTGVDILLQELNALKDKPQHSEIDSSKRPYGGIVGETSVYWRVNQLIVLLGLSGDKRALDTLCDIVNQTEAGGPQQANPRLHWRRIPNYDRIISLCFSLDLLADKKCIPALEALSAKPFIGGYTAKKGIDGEQKFSSAYLELVIGRTLAKCGGSKEILDNYAGDIRSVLADHACDVLHGRG